jgi:hypothetical protein
MNAYNVGEGDSGWVIDLLCSDANGPVELLSASSILLYLRRTDRSAAREGLGCAAVADYAFTSPSGVVNPGTSGKHCIARYTGVSADTVNPGTYDGTVQVTWASGRVESFPTTAAHFQVIIAERP